MDGKALVVEERGSDAPSSLCEGLDLVFVRQADDEDEDGLLRETFDCIRSQREGAVRCAILTCNDDVSSITIDTRALIARALLGAVMGAEQGRLWLVARAKAPSPVRLSILALADALVGTIVGTSISVSVLFLDEDKKPTHKISHHRHRHIGAA